MSTPACLPGSNSLKTLERRLGVDERAVHAEVFRPHQPSLLRLRCHLVEEQLAHVVLHQPRPIFGERAVVETEKQVVAHC
jgi:hypothetical protein